MNETRRRGPIARFFIGLWDAMNFTRRLVFNLLFFAVLLLILAAFAYWGIGMPLGAGLGLGLGWGPRGMWIGLIAGLLVAAVLLSTRFLRSSRRVPVAAGRQ